MRRASAVKAADRGLKAEWRPGYKPFGGGERGVNADLTPPDPSGNLEAAELRTLVVDPLT